LFKRLLKDGHNLVAKSSRMVAKIQESTPFLKGFKISDDGEVLFESR
jgi:hypothetical protein